MNWPGKITLKVGATIPCPLVDQCYSGCHCFEVTQTAATPLLAADEKEIRLKLQSQLDFIITKFLEVHK